VAIELQIRTDLLAPIIANAVQAKLLETCFPQVGTLYVDHADVAPLPVQLVSVDGQVRARVPIDLYIVERSKLLSAPNAVPDGATVPAGRVTLVLGIAAAGATLTVRCVDVELGALASFLPGAPPAGRCGLLGAAATPLSLDLKPMLAALGAPTPAASQVELMGPILAIRFDPIGVATDRLIPGQPWGLFIDAAAVMALVTRQIPAKALKQLQAIVPGLAPQWSPAGGVLRVEMTLSASIDFEFLGFDVLSVDFSGGILVELLLVPGETGFLKIVLHRSAHIDAGALVPRSAERAGERKIKALMKPTNDFTKTGEDTFEKLVPLPPIALGRARLRYDAILGTPPGMALGGAGLLGVPPSRETLSATAHAFGRPTSLYTCRELAKSGSGDPPKTVSIDETSTSGWIDLISGGSFCGYELVQPGGIESFVSAPPTGPGPDPRAIDITIPSRIALWVTAPVQIVVKTARGVRFLDLGVPPRAEMDGEGNVTNWVRLFIPDCLFLPADSPYRVDWGGLLDRDILDPPMETPDWLGWLATRPAIETQLVSLSGLETGELIEFRSADHRILVAADREGRALMPVVVPVGAGFAASLTRLSRRPLGRSLTVEGALFVRAGTLAASGEAELNPQPLPPVAARRLRRLVRGRTTGSGEADLNPQPLPPKAAALERTLRRRLPGLARLVPLPGFEQSALALAVMESGPKLVIDAADRRRPRVAGTFEGPLGPLVAAGDWGAAPAQSGRLALFRVRRA
jgi:hypothetical protein